jgi:hypothetical protein
VPVFWIIVCVTGFFSAIVARAVAKFSRLWWGALAVGVFDAIAILILTISDGEWLAWFLGLGLGVIGWTALDRAANRRGRQQ